MDRNAMYREGLNIVYSVCYRRKGKEERGREGEGRGGREATSSKERWGRESASWKQKEDQLAAVEEGTGWELSLKGAGQVSSRS